VTLDIVPKLFGDSTPEAVENQSTAIRAAFLQAREFR
jgi:hypothetical protein